MSLINWAPFSQIRPPMKTPSAPVAWIFLKIASYEEAFGSYEAKPAISMPSDFAAFWKFVATPRPYASLSFRT